MGKGTTLTMEEVERLEVKPLQRKLLEVSIFCLMMALYWKNCLYKEFYQNIEKLQNFADVMIISLVSDDGILGDGTMLKEAPFKDEIFTIDKVMEIKKYYRIKKMVVTHIDEIWGKSYGYYNELEKKLDNIFFAYDGMEIIV